MKIIILTNFVIITIKLVGVVNKFAIVFNVRNSIFITERRRRFILYILYDIHLYILFIYFKLQS